MRLATTGTFRSTATVFVDTLLIATVARPLVGSLRISSRFLFQVFKTNLSGGQIGSSLSRVLFQALDLFFKTPFGQLRLASGIGQIADESFL